jgi:hypothetical protein
MFSGNHINFLSYLVLKIRSDQSQGDIPMGTNRKRTKAIRSRKTKPNKANLKAKLRRIHKNAEILKEFAADEEK